MACPFRPPLIISGGASGVRPSHLGAPDTIAVASSEGHSGRGERLNSPALSHSLVIQRPAARPNNRSMRAAADMELGAADAKGQGRFCGCQPGSGRTPGHPCTSMCLKSCLKVAADRGQPSVGHGPPQLADSQGLTLSDGEPRGEPVKVPLVLTTATSSSWSLGTKRWLAVHPRESAT